MKQPDEPRKALETIKPRTFAEVIRAYMRSEKFAALSESSRYGYNQYLKVAERQETLGAIPVGVLRPFMVQGFLDAFADRPGAQERAWGALRAVEKWAFARDLVPIPFTLGTEIIGTKGQHRPWTEAQIETARHYARPAISRLVTLASNTGQRGSDLCKMRWSDIEKIEGRAGINVIQKKTGLELWVPFTEQLQEVIATWERRPGFILLKDDGSPWDNRKQLSMAWNRERDTNPKLTACAGMVMHGLRASAVIRLRRAGAPPTMIADMVGLSVPMVEHYCRLADRKQSALAAVHYLDRTSAERAGLPKQGSHNKTGS